ncbi:MAG: Gfo/Idh/MocA family oxidoreductase [Tannerella sp.]|jgi:predicted dehydrogenase|nr:Gfo/Idh/MocA family oxidoreductase [Tannerella sp.]
MNKNLIDRRSFLKSSALVGTLGALGTGSASVLSSCAGEGKAKAEVITPLKAHGTYYVPELPDLAKDGKELKAGVIGCGGRGSGAAKNFLRAGNGLKITALGDTFQDRIDGCLNGLKNDFKDTDFSGVKQFVGLDAYKQVIDSDVDVIITATPPNFRPLVFQYAVEKGKHCFLEKPICVDPVGYRTIVQTAKLAASKNLAVITGTQRHHERSYVASYQKIMDGLIGEIVGGTVWWNGGMLWYNDRKPEWSDCEWMIRDWVNWEWLSGDHIVEQHVHNIDVWTWFTGGLKPKSATGFGSRQRRVTGDQFDNFSIDFEMENGIHLHSMCRQVESTASNVSEFLQGTKGSWWSRNMEIKNLKGEVIWKYDHEAEKANFQQRDPYTLEHVNWVNHIRAGKVIDQASETALSNMYAIMGRESAYSGKRVSWEEITASSLNLYPEDIDLVKPMACAKQGFGSGKEYILPDFIPIAGSPSPGSKQIR